MLQPTNEEGIRNKYGTNTSVISYALSMKAHQSFSNESTLARIDAISINTR
jgi:hypothetical protein